MTFSADWLALREPADARARSLELLAELPERAPLDVVDLGAGTGANLRYLAPRLGGLQHWRLVDHDSTLLAAIGPATRAWAAAQRAVVARRHDVLQLRGPRFDCRVQAERHDLGGGTETLELPSGGLVTASALLDLVSAEWLAALAAQCAAASVAAVLFALTYDGRASCAPEEPEDAEVIELVNRHQRRDKGFGSALGPAAAEAAAHELARAGFTIATRRSDWRLGAEHAELQDALLDGWLAAAVELAPARRAALERWRERRAAHLEHGRSALVVGHVDLIGCRARPRAVK